MNDDLGKYQVTDRLPWFVEVKEFSGSIVLYAFAVGVITAIIDDPYHTADQTVEEIRETLSDLKKALRANGEPRENKSLKLYHKSTVNIRRNFE